MQQNTIKKNATVEIQKFEINVTVDGCNGFLNVFQSVAFMLNINEKYQIYEEKKTIDQQNINRF